MDDFFKLPDASFPFPDVSQILRAAAPGPWVGGLTPMQVVIARSDRAAVVLNELAAFPDGFSLRITSHVHRSVKLPDQFSLMMGSRGEVLVSFPTSTCGSGLPGRTGPAPPCSTTGNAASSQRRRIPTTGWSPWPATPTFKGAPPSTGPGPCPPMASWSWSSSGRRSGSHKVPLPSTSRCSARQPAAHDRYGPRTPASRATCHGAGCAPRREDRRESWGTCSEHGCVSCPVACAPGPAPAFTERAPYPLPGTNSRPAITRSGRTSVHGQHRRSTSSGTSVSACCGSKTGRASGGGGVPSPPSACVAGLCLRRIALLTC